VGAGERRWQGLWSHAVFLHQDSPEIGLTRVRLADFQCLDQEKAPALLTAMLQVAVDRCRRESIHMLELIGLSAQLEREDVLFHDVVHCSTGCTATKQRVRFWRRS
jgi:hypothetical protein